MYKITLSVFGDRLRQIREHLKLSQYQLSQEVHCKQNAISNLEKGKGGSITLMFNLLNYFSQYVFIDLIFSEKFYLISNNAAEEARKSNFIGIIIEIILQAEAAHQEAVNNVISKAAFRKAIDKVIEDAINDVQKDVCRDINAIVQNSLGEINQGLNKELNKVIELLK